MQTIYIFASIMYGVLLVLSLIANFSNYLIFEAMYQSAVTMFYPSRVAVEQIWLLFFLLTCDILLVTQIYM